MSLLNSITAGSIMEAAGQIYFKRPPVKNMMIFLQRGDATGDLTHIGPVVGINPARAVLVFDTRETAGKGRMIASTYVDSFKLPVDRVRYVDTGLASTRLVLQQFGTVKGGNVCVDIDNTDDNRSSATSRLGFATYDMRDAILDGKGGARTQVKEVLRGGKLARNFASAADSPDFAVLNWLTQTLRIPLHRHVLVLWGRRAADKVPIGLHPDQDHNTGLMQGLLERATYRNYTVLLAGDFKHDEFPGHDVTDKGDRSGRAIFLGKFWEKLPGGGDRAKQIRMFYILWKALKWRQPRLGMLHCGPRSGALDGYGFSGQPVLYLYGGADKDERMGNKIAEPFAQADHKTLKHTFRRWHLPNAPRVESPQGTWKDGKVDESDAYALIGEITRRFKGLDGV